MHGVYPKKEFDKITVYYSGIRLYLDASRRRGNSYQIWRLEITNSSIEKSHGIPLLKEVKWRFHVDELPS